MKLLYFFVLCCFSVTLLMGQQLYQNRTFSSGLGNSTGLNVSVSVSDYDLDGDDDFFIGRNGQPNRLYRNNGDGTFTDVATQAGVVDDNEGTFSAVWGDLDNDGDPDLYVGNRLMADKLYLNNGDGTFTDITSEAGINNTDEARSVMLADVDNDGFLDIYVANFFDENIMYRNNGNLTFSNQTVMRNVTDSGLSLGAMFVDYDLDGDQDLYLTHDGNQANILYQNNGSGYFSNVSVASGTNYAGFGMGVDAGDINHDGYPDLYITNLYDNILLLNDGDGTFTNINATARINDLGMGWGTTFLDYDNDGWLDIYVVNNTLFSPFPNVLYRNLGDNTFEIVSENQAVASPFGGYGSASADLNQDGKQDLLVTNYGQGGGIQYFLNDVVNDHHWMDVKLEGTVSNRDAVGARIVIEAGELTLTEEVCSGSGYAAQNSLTQHFGLRDVTQIDRLTVYWPSGLVEEFTELSADQLIRIVEGQGLISSVVEPSALANLKIFPNPVANQLRLALGEGLKSSAQVTILDLLGRVCLSKKIAAGQTELSFDVTNLTPGGYSLRVTAEGEVKTLVLIKGRKE